MQTGQTVAIKKINLGKAKEGVNVTALREIKLLKELNGPRIVRLLDVFPHKGNLSLVSTNITQQPEVVQPHGTALAVNVSKNGFMVLIVKFQVFEFMQTDLEIIIKDRSLTLSAADVKSYIQMVLQGLEFCHKRWVLHRDIKPNNFLISADGASTHTAALSNPIMLNPLVPTLNQAHATRGFIEFAASWRCNRHQCVGRLALCIFHGRF